MISVRSASRAAVLLLSTLLAVAVVSPADAKPKKPPRQSWVVHTSGVLVIGDSMTVGARPHLPSTWNVDALWGRGVTQLPKRIDEWNASHEFPRVAVLALGTNEQAGWSKQRYLDAVAKFPRETRIVFVTTWRPRATSDGATYSYWMSDVARLRPGTQIADWRAAASADPSLVSPDGLHQSAAGKREWARLVREAVNRAAVYKPRRR